MTAVPELYLESASLTPGTAFATYQATLPFYRLGLGPGVTQENFEFSARAWSLGDLILSRTRASAVTVSRTLEHIRSDNTDNYSFFSFTSGSWIGDFGGRPITVGAGQLVGFDLSKPFEAQSTDHSAFALAVARSALGKQFRDVPDLHGHVFEGVAAEMLLDHMLSVERWIPSIRESEIATVARATMGVVNALLTSVPKRVELEPGALAFQHEVRRFIENHLHDPDLTPERIAREMSVTRSTLFRNFKPLGGVAAYVQRRRLEVVRGLLLNPAETRSITDLALTFGFANQSHFAVAFKKAFGRSATEMRSLVALSRPEAPAAEDVPTAYREWKRALVLR
jgi:AraC-like DNA-binding protein